MGNVSLHNANRAKNDEFYTQLADIENELRHYKDQLKDKVILCNCDDPFESNFFKYFAMNFNQLMLKKLIATCYSPSPIANTQLSLFDYEVAVETKGMEKSINYAYKIELDQVKDVDDSGSISISDVEQMLEIEKNTLKSGGKSDILTHLEGDGDFRSAECVELLKQADVVVTNPPFSLFRQYVAQLVEYDKKFLIIGNKNAITYKDTFKLIKDNKLWTGYRSFSGGMWFKADYDGKTEKTVNGVKLINVPTIWFTNLFVDKTNNPIVLYIKYEDGVKRGLYPKYDNYDAIEVSKVAEIPVDYYGAMGVPITFLDKWTPSVTPPPPSRRARSSQSSDSTGISKATEFRTVECVSTTRRFMRESSSCEFEIIWTTDRGGDGMLDDIKLPHTRYDAPIVNGKGLYKRIIIRRIRDN